MNVIRSLWSRYNTAQKNYPLTLTMLSSGIIVGLADGLAQYLEGNGWNKRRSVGMSLHGILFIAPVAHTWFKFLNKMIPIHTKANPFRWLCLSVLVDQCLMSPNFTMAFFVTRGIIDKKEPHEIVDKIKSDTFHVWTRSVNFWAPIAFGNFYFVPLQHRVLVLNSASFLWNLYLAAKAKYHLKAAEDLHK